MGWKRTPSWQGKAALLFAARGELTPLWQGHGVLFAHCPARWWQGEAGDRAHLPQEVLQWWLHCAVLALERNRGRAESRGRGFAIP